jgi:hypothetical protein
MTARFEFDPDKALSSTAYLAERTGETMYTILKMLYVADRCHLERYGRPITGDNFFALPEGACPSKIYDSMKSLRGEIQTNYMPASDRYLEVDRTTNDVNVKDMPSLETLSASDIECLDETISILRRLGRYHMRDLAHDDAWKNTAMNREMDFISIAQSIDGSGNLAKHIVSRFD